MRLFDTHCHLDFDAYDADRLAVMERAYAAGVRRLLIPAVDFDSMAAAFPLMEADSPLELCMAVGVHPNSTADWTGAEIGALRAGATRAKVVAVGEIGLDYHWDFSPPDVQRRAFEAQLALAAELELPVIIHNREASHDVLPILESWAATLPDSLRERPGVLHSFSAPPEYAERALAIGFYLGFTGPLTYKKADDLRSIASHTPPDRLLIETDGPYLTPHPHRGQRNEPAYVALVAERLAALHQVSVEEIAAMTTANGERLFGL